MGEIPTPQSIAIGTLIGLYSDPNSPLLLCNTSSDEDRYECGGELRRSPAVEMRLSRLIQELVMDRDEGVVVLNDSYNDPIYDVRQEDIREDIHDDIREEGRENNSMIDSEWLDEEEMLREWLRDDNLLDAPLPQKPRRDEKSSWGERLAFRMETLSSLLDRIDAACWGGDRSCEGRSPPAVALLDKLHKSSSSVDDLMNLLDEWHAMLAGTHAGCGDGDDARIAVDGDSAFGTYLRRQCLEMEEMPFEAMARLWTALTDYVQNEVRNNFHHNTSKNTNIYYSSTTNPSTSNAFPHDSSTNNSSTNNHCNDNFSNANSSKLLVSSTWLPSAPQMERIVRRACHRFHSSLPSASPQPSSHNSSLSSSTSHHTPSPTYDLLQTHPECPSLHFYLFLQKLRRGERSQALESLHRYFDYAMIHERKERAERAMTNDSSKFESNVMQYAAILLAQTHHRFGYGGLSLQATEEAVRVAQQSGDDECVSFAMGWLARSSAGRRGGHGGVTAGIASAVSGTHSRLPKAPREDDDAMLHRCRARAAERGLATLAAGASFELARRTVYSNRHAGTLWNAIESAGQMSGASHGGPAGGSTEASHGNASATDIHVMTGEEALRLLGRQCLAETGLWDATGHAALASLSSSAALYGFGSNLPAEDAALAANRVVSSMAYGAGLDLWTQSSIPSSTLSSIPSRIPPASKIHATTLRTMLSLSNVSLPSISSTLQEWSVRSYDLAMGRALRVLLANRAALPVSVEASLVSWTRASHLYVQQGMWEQAKWMTRRACWLAHEEGLVFHHGYQLLQLSFIELECVSMMPLSPSTHTINLHSSASSTKGTTNLRSSITPTPCTHSLPHVERALPPLLECLSLAQTHSMDPLRAVALTVLSKIHLFLGRYWTARAVLHGAMPLVMEHAHAFFQGEANLLLAKCNLAEARWIEERNHTTSYGIRSGTERNRNSRKKKESNAVTNLRRTSYAQLQTAASVFTSLDDVCRLRHVYYLQARICHLLRWRKERDAASVMFAKMGAKRRRAADSSLGGARIDTSNVTINGREWWDALQCVMMTKLKDANRCIKFMEQRETK